MKKIYFLGGFLAINIYSIAQTSPAIQWQKSFGGSLGEFATAIKQTPDEGYIVAGNTLSNDGDVSGNHGRHDVWVLKLNSDGAIQWKKTLGGSGEDLAYAIDLTFDKGYIVAGYSSSNDGDVSGNHGDDDYWVVKLNDNGIIQWEKSLGGSKDDNAYSIKQTLDSGYIIAGGSASDDGDVSGNKGYQNDWIVKLNSNGTLQWQKCFGGSDGEGALSIEQTTDGGYIVAGNSSSDDGDVGENYGGFDIWIIKLDSSGIIQWQKNLGGSDFDETYSIKQTSDGGYIIGGSSNSNDGDVNGNHGMFDYWIVELSGDGTIQWQKSLGGSGFDYAWSIEQTQDDGYIMAGESNSLNGNVTGNHGVKDAWIVRVSGSGDLLWQRCFGGSDFDEAYSIEQTSDGGYIMAAGASSDDGDVSGNHGYDDYWVVKLKPDNILPVTMLTLTGKAQGKQNLLQWTTLTEKNNSGFEVQRSNDGYNFSKIAFVNTKAINGNSNFKLSYDFLDIASASSNNYYRLKQIDKDNTYTYSNIVLIRDENILAADDITIYPNPAKNILNVKISLTGDSNVKLSVTDMTGKILLGKSILAAKGESIIQLDISHLSAGSYLIKTVFENGIKAEKKFVKEHQ